MPSSICILLFAFLVLSGSTPAAASERTHGDPVAALRGFLAQPDSRIDFAKAKLLFDRFSDPMIDVSTSIKEIDTMADAARRMAGPNAAPLQRLAAVRRIIYVSGDWNGHHHDLSDPLGRRAANRLLSTYLKTRRGNCISMPVLFLALGDRLGVHVTLSTAPMHEFVKYVDDVTGKVYNLETTSGGFPARDVWYRQNLPMTDRAIKSGVYLKTLTRKQSVAVMAEPLIEHYIEKRDYRTAIALSDLVLAAYPQFPVALIERGAAYGGLIDLEFRPKYLRPIDIPSRLVPTYLAYVHQAESSFDKLDALGWQRTDGEAQAKLATQ